MEDNKKIETLQYINKERAKNNSPKITESEIAEQLKDQFLDDQYVAMEVNKAKEKAIQDLKNDKVK